MRIPLTTIVFLVTTVGGAALSHAVTIGHSYGVQTVVGAGKTGALVRKNYIVRGGDRGYNRAMTKGPYPYYIGGPSGCCN